MLEPRFLAFLAHPFDATPLDIIFFHVTYPLDGNKEGHIIMQKITKESNPLCFKYIVNVW